MSGGDRMAPANLWDAAWCLHPAGDPAAEAFVARHARTILRGGAKQVATALDKAARAARLMNRIFARGR